MFVKLSEVNPESRKRQSVFVGFCDAEEFLGYLTQAMSFDPSTFDGTTYAVLKSNMFTDQTVEFSMTEGRQAGQLEIREQHGSGSRAGFVNKVWVDMEDIQKLVDLHNIVIDKGMEMERREMA